MIFDVIRHVRESVGDELLIAIGSGLTILISSVIAIAKRLWKLNFIKVDAKKRCKILTKIGALQHDEGNPQSANIIKTIHESIGIYIPWKYSEYVFEYAREKGIRDNDASLNIFLKSPRYMDIDKDVFKISKAKYWQRMFSIWFMTIMLTIVFLGLSLFALKLASIDAVSHGGMYKTYKNASIISFGIWVAFYIGFVIESGRLLNVKRFYNAFAPWLQQRLTEEKEPEPQQVIAIISEIERPRPVMEKEPARAMKPWPMKF